MLCTEITVYFSAVFIQNANRMLVSLSSANMQGNNLKDRPWNGKRGQIRGNKQS